MIKAQDLQFKRGDDVLFEGLSFVVHPTQRVAVAGRNGVGKSTLFKLILGELTSDIGTLDVPSTWRIGHMAQEVEATQRAALDYVVDGHDELRRIERALETTEDDHQLAQLHSDLADVGGYEADARAGEILYGLGFAADDFKKPYAEFSGGWRIRLNLAQALMTPCDLLLLDEPTNHLDLEAIMWLEGWLVRFPGTVLLIAHDRSFLDACADHTLYLAGGSGRLFKGNYSSCERQRAEQLQHEQALQARRATQAAHIQKFVDRFRAKASKAKQVQSRIKALERLQNDVALVFDSPYKVGFKNPDKVSNPLFSLRRVDLGYDDTTVLNKVDQSVLPGARIGVLGVNGAGKSTLLKALVGELAPQSGDLMRGSHAEVGYFAQHQLETLNQEINAQRALLDLRPRWTEQQCRDYLGGWGFTASMTQRSIATLSGGEKARLVLALVAVEQPAILIFDEPTNHLDLDMRDALALALAEYNGAVVIVSHDRTLLEKTIDEFWVLDQGRLSTYRGDLADYTAASQSTITTPQARAEDATSAQPANRKEARQARAAKRQSVQAYRNQVKQLERDMQAQGEQLSEIETKLADSDTYQALATEELDAMLANAGKLRVKLEHTEEAWLRASEALDAEENLENGR